MSWKDTLLDASFKGVGFDVIDDTLRGTHALAEHEYPFVQGSDIEDTGVSAMDMSLTAVLWGDDYESRLQSLLGVCGRLVRVSLSTRFTAACPIVWWLILKPHIMKKTPITVRCE